MLPGQGQRTDGTGGGRGLAGIPGPATSAPPCHRRHPAHRGLPRLGDRSRVVGASRSGHEPSCPASRTCPAGPRPRPGGPPLCRPARPAAGGASPAHGRCRSRGAPGRPDDGGRSRAGSDDLRGTGRDLRRRSGLLSADSDGVGRTDSTAAGGPVDAAGPAGGTRPQPQPPAREHAGPAGGCRCACRPRRQSRASVVRRGRTRCHRRCRSPPGTAVPNRPARRPTTTPDRRRRGRRAPSPRAVASSRSRRSGGAPQLSRPPQPRVPPRRGLVRRSAARRRPPPGQGCGLQHPTADLRTPLRRPHADPGRSHRALARSQPRGPASPPPPRLPAEAMSAHAAGDSPRDRQAIASRADLPSELALRLLTDPVVTVRRVAAANPNLPHDRLCSLLSDHDPVLREGAASNPALPVHVIERLLADT
ncbi:hypothetical protein BCF44_1356 [Kutzneria buriramensis]|uniref:Leucine rich repeat (LRR) protein n=1 Tax=Kutzneria buriramensis TaxID=1045776 RepID=A0A3E0GSI9_9PSEU|nr:hypothetical protein BCF44_1356 [Kutzneria buriramensis]